MIDDDRGQMGPTPVKAVLLLNGVLIAAIIAIDRFTDATTNFAETGVVETASPPPLEPFVIGAVLAVVIVLAARLRNRLRGDRS